MGENKSRLAKLLDETAAKMARGRSAPDRGKRLPPDTAS